MFNVVVVIWVVEKVGAKDEGWALWGKWKVIDLERGETAWKQPLCCIYLCVQNKISKMERGSASFIFRWQVEGVGTVGSFWLQINWLIKFDSLVIEFYRTSAEVCSLRKKRARESVCVGMLNKLFSTSLLSLLLGKLQTQALVLA